MWRSHSKRASRALDNQCVVYGSHIAGIVGEKEPDLILYPDYDTFSIAPMASSAGKVARLIGDMRRADGSANMRLAPEYILKKNSAGSRRGTGYTCYADPE